MAYDSFLATSETVVQPDRPPPGGGRDSSAHRAIGPATMGDFVEGGWIRNGQTLCLIGASGTGKSHLLMTLGTMAASEGYRVGYHLAKKLINDLITAPNDKQLAKVILRYGNLDLLIVDDFGYLELDRLSADLLLEVFTQRQDTSSIAVASHQPLSQWLDTFSDLPPSAAIIDRLTRRGTTINTGTYPYRAPPARNGHHTGGPTPSPR